MARWQDNFSIIIVIIIISRNFNLKVGTGVRTRGKY